MTSCWCRLGLSLVVAITLPATLAAAGWSSAGRLITPRYSHTATVLQNGTVLVAGGSNNGPLATAEIYNPVTRSWSPTGSMAAARSGHTATLLANGTVLVAGGDGAFGTLASSEIFDPSTGSWHSTMAGLLGPRSGHTATLLRDGTVLVVGGVPSTTLPLIPLASAERYSPASGTWQATGSPQFAYFRHTANLLADGRVVIAGGNGREIYDPSAGGWSLAAPFIVDDPVAAPFPISRLGHASAVLSDGRVLTVGGGVGRDQVAASNEIYDPVLDQRTPVAALAQLADVTTTLLPDGRVLEAGGVNTNLISGAGDPAGVSQVRVSIYDAASDAWTAAPDLGHQRTNHTATLLSDGHILVVGGIDPHISTFGSRHLVPGAPVAEAELYAPSGPGVVVPATFSIPDPDQQLPPGSPAVLLPNGTVLLPLGGQVYDPATGLRTAVTLPQLPHSGGTATLLVSGRVLIVGGSLFGGPGTGAEVYDPATRLWSPTGSLGTARSRHTATLLPDGRVLVVGGSGLTSPLASAEVYDPASGLWTPTAALSTPRTAHTASLLSDGRVLVVGGAAAAIGGGNSLDTFLGTAEIYDPVSGTWAPTGGLTTPRAEHTATLLPNGQVLVIGGTNQNDDGEGGIAGAEIYDPSVQEWTPSGSMAGPRANHTATLLMNGMVLVVGIFTNEGAFPTQFVESSIYDTSTGTFTGGPDVCRRIGGAATLLPDGRVLISGGDNPFPCLDQTYAPDSGPDARRPRLLSTTGALVFGSTFVVTGSRFRGDSEAGSGTTTSSAANYPVVQVRSIEGGQTTWIVPDARPSFGDEPMTLQFSRLPASLNPGFHLVTAFVDGMPSLPASAAASAVVGLSCSIAITTPPAPQTVPLGTSATFSVVAQGARAYQWRKDGIPIPGATGTSYTTPPIQGADSGSLYDVVVSGPCASATSVPAVLTVADSTPPMAAVVTPGGGENWLLSPASGPVNTEQVAWSMSDNVRVCQVRVSLLYSNDAGVSYLQAPAAGGLPRVFGPGGSCAFPGVSDTSLTYSLPATYPSGKSGSLYRIQVEVFDQVGLRAVAQSQNPFYIVQSNPDVRTLILSNTSRMQTVLGLTADQAAAIDTKLHDLSVHPRVQGVVVDLGLVSALAPYYAALDAAVAGNSGSVDAANTLLFGANGIHDQVLSNLRAFPGVRYLILVGDDRIIPLARMPDGTALFDESNYPAGGDLSGSATAVGQALQAKRFLSDDPLGLVATVRSADLSTGLFLPDLSVGRLVETPQEITTTIATFIGQDGVLDLGALDPASGHKVLVTGYDFLQDSALRIRDRWKAVFGAAGSPSSALSPVDGGLIGGDWGLTPTAARRAALLAGLCGNGGPRYGIASLSGHASHSLEGVPADNGSFTDIEGLATAALLDPNACGAGRGIDLSGGVVYAVGCHGGLPVPGSDPGDVNHSLDLAQTLLSRGVVAYVANSGYGWGPRFGPGYSKLLMEILSELLATPGTIVTGDAVRAAKLRYFDQTGSPDAYDTKSLMQWTFYGLPMYAVKTGIPAAAASSSALVQSAGRLRTASTATVERVAGVTVKRQAAAVSAAASTLPPSLTELDLRFDFTAAGVYQKQGASGGLLTGPGCSDPNGCYYTLNGLATGKTDLPVQPYFVYDSRLSGTSQHGALWMGGTYDQEPGWKPVFTELVSNGGDGSDHGAAPRQIGENPTGTRRVPGSDPSTCAASDSEVNSLVVTTGEVLTAQPGDAAYSTERRYREVNLEALYFNNTVDPTQNCDRSGPTIAAGPLPGGLYHSLDGTLIQWAVPVSDPAGVWRVVVVVNDNSVDALGRGTWTPVELADDGSGTWRGSFTAAGAGTVTYMIQSVDNRGNVSWLDFTAASVTPAPLALAAAPSGTGLPSSGVPLKIPLPVDVVVTGAAGPHVDAFSPPRGLVGASVSIFGRNLTGTTAVAFNGRSAQFVELSATSLMAVVPVGATTGPISVTTAVGTGSSATSFIVVSGLSVGDVSVKRPVAGSVTATFTVNLAPASAQAVSVHYQTVDGSASAGTDYTTTAGTLTFAPGESLKTVSVVVLGNGASGPPKTFFLDLSAPVGADLVRARGEATIARPWRVFDFNGDGKTDLLWQEERTGELALWLFDANRRIGALSLLPEKVADRRQEVVGLGDFNGDGQTDIAFQHETSGAVTLWLMNGTKRTSSVAFTPARPAAWRLADVGDWNGDDGADLLWQNQSTGALEVWFLQGTTFATSAHITPTRPATWRVMGTADWNGDGHRDILWQNQTNGQLEVWYMNGTARVGSAVLSPSRPSWPQSRLVAVADFTGDGKPDLLFRNASSGELTIWVMNGTVRTGVLAASGVNFPGELNGTPGRILFDPQWQVVAPR